MPRTKSVKQVVVAEEAEVRKRCEEGFEYILPDCPKFDKFVSTG